MPNLLPKNLNSEFSRISFSGEQNQKFEEKLKQLVVYVLEKIRDSIFRTKVRHSAYVTQSVLYQRCL